MKVRSSAALTAALWLGVGGCAGVSGPPEERPAPSLVRATAPPEYDFLVGYQLEIDGRSEEALRAYQRAAAKDPDAAYLQRKIAQLAARQGDLTGAIEHGERAHALDPDDIDTRMLLGTLYRVRRDPAAAEAVLRRVDGEPLRGDAAFLLYTIYMEAERYPEALDAARWIVDRDPESLRGWFALAGVYERMNQPLEVERALQGALDRQPGNLAVYGALARTRRSRGDREGEIEVYEQVLARYPHHHATLTAKADALIALGRSDEAISVLAEVGRYHPEDVRSSVRLALLEYDAGQYDAAGERLEAALAANPDEHEVAYLLGLVRQRQGLDDEAFEAFARVDREHRYYVDARTQMAVILEDREAYREALAQVEMARDVRATRPLDLYSASLRAKAGDFDDAVAFLGELLAESPDDDEILYNLGVLHGEAGRYPEALQYVQRALGQNPDNPSALNYVGYSWAERGENLEQAEAYITRALELRPDDGYITDSLGWVYYMRARPLLRSGSASEKAQGRALAKKALGELERASQLTGGDPVIAEHMGDVYLALDEKRRALELYEAAMGQGPRTREQPELQRKYDRLRQELGVK
jgi:tetratricopeptide (TPR) repeat protein